jgi:PEP-CTERM motif
MNKVHASTKGVVMKVKKIIGATFVAALVAISPVAANAATSNYTFGLNKLVGSGPVTQDFATLSINTTDYKTFTFDLKLSTGLNSIFDDAGTFISSLRVNTLTGNDPTSSAIASGSWGVGSVSQNNQNNNTGSIGWDFSESFGGSGNTAASRLTQGEEVKWTSVFKYVQNPLLGNPGLSLKVQGYGWADFCGTTSAEYIPDVTVSAVPEPETYAMMLAGLGLMGTIARRRKNKNA